MVYWQRSVRVVVVGQVHDFNNKVLEASSYKRCWCCWPWALLVDNQLPWLTSWGKHKNSSTSLLNFNLNVFSWKSRIGLESSALVFSALSWTIWHQFKWRMLCSIASNWIYMATTNNKNKSWSSFVFWRRIGSLNGMIILRLLPQRSMESTSSLKCVSKFGDCFGSENFVHHLVDRLEGDSCGGGVPSLC